MARANYAESREQQLLISLIDSYYPEWLIFHTPNGGRRAYKEAVIFKRMGVRAGVADLFLVEPTLEYHGLFLEMKKPGSKDDLSDDQKIFRDEVLRRGFHYAVADNGLEGLIICEEFLGIENPISARMNLIG